MAHCMVRCLPLASTACCVVECAHIILSFFVLSMQGYNMVKWTFIAGVAAVGTMAFASVVTTRRDARIIVEHGELVATNKELVTRERLANDAATASHSANEKLGAQLRQTQDALVAQERRANDAEDRANESEDRLRCELMSFTEEEVAKMSSSQTSEFMNLCFLYNVQVPPGDNEARPEAASTCDGPACARSNEGAREATS